MNRSAITITPKQPFIDWANTLTPEFPMEINVLGESHTYLTNPDFDNADKHIKKYYKEIKQAETLTNVPGALILSIIFTESAGNPSIVSYVGAAGLMQLKPQTANDVIYLEKKAGRLTPGEIAVKYDTNRQGPFRKTITLTTNVEASPMVALKIKGTVLPKS